MLVTNANAFVVRALERPVQYAYISIARIFRESASNATTINTIAINSVASRPH